MNANDKNSENNSNLIAYDSNQSHLIQNATPSSLQITNLNDSTIKQQSKKTKNYSKYAKANRRKHKRRRRK